MNKVIIIIKGKEGIKMRETIIEKIKKSYDEYEDVKDRINLIKCDGSLSKLCNLRSEFDETFDAFFDKKELRIKYDDWSYKYDCPLFEKSSLDLFLLLDEKDLTEFLDFVNESINSLQEELDKLNLHN